MPNWLSYIHPVILVIAVIVLIVVLRTHGKIKKIDLHVEINGKEKKD